MSPEQNEQDEQDEQSGRAEDPAAGPVFSPVGVASAVLAMVAVAALVLSALIWSGHRDQLGELGYRTRAMQAATDWTRVLINMNSDNVDGSLQTLRDGTVGDLNAEFDAAVTPYREVVQTLQAQTTGQIEAVAYEAVHHDLGIAPAVSLPTEIASRTDDVIVIASSVSQNVGGPPQTVRWNLRLGVSDVDGRLFITRLESMR